MAIRFRLDLRLAMAAGPNGRATMNFDFSDDQKMLKDQARKFLEEQPKPKGRIMMASG